jgi:3-dehydroshikimate dehydratase
LKWEQNMFQSGLVSITFRKLQPAEIVRLVSEAGLEGIEWGGDVHVPHGDMKAAREVRRLTEDAGLTVAAYGSYYRVGHSEDDGLKFEHVLETAVELSAPLVRVWAGNKGSTDVDIDFRKRVVSESRRIADIAATAGVIVAYEFHGGTLTDTTASARSLLEEVTHPNLKTLWQPNGSPDVDERLGGLLHILPWLTNLHVFQWEPAASGENDKRPLAEGEKAWSEYLALAATTGRKHWALLEFVRDDAPEAFLRDAHTLKEWLLSYRSEQ